MTEKICKNCDCLRKKWISTIKQREDLKKELIELSRRYTKAIHLISLLQESEVKSK